MLKALDAGYQLEPEGLKFLGALPGTVDPLEVVEAAIQEQLRRDASVLSLPKSLLEEAAQLSKPKLKPEPMPESVGPTWRPPAAEVEARVSVLLDPNKEGEDDPSLEGFVEYFRDRFRKTERMLRRRTDARDAIPIKEARRASVNNPVKVIGMVTEKRERGNYIRLELEDLEASIPALVPKNAERSLVVKAQAVLLDQVLCVAGFRAESGILIVTDIVMPDLPDRRPTASEEDVCAALISDIHVGSRMFLGKAFDKFLQWLQGRAGSPEQRSLAGRVKYLVVAGDLVDGIGVYPEQERELVITDVYKQYEEVAKLLSHVPEHVEILVIPGNHDAVRQALPQPAIPRKYAEPLYGDPRIRMLGGPAWVELHGVRLLAYHGRSLDDVIGSVPSMSFQEPDAAMELLLKARHLCPSFGQRTPISPQREDLLIVDRIPDIFQAGHIHVFRYRNYRGTLVVNSGAWQSQTVYQRKNGLNPVPGVIPVVNLKTMEVSATGFL
ncbi:MAG: DNA-directed DNA polymerase II small subunit [Candidatus Bathyarchaeia archaeon]